MDEMVFMGFNEYDEALYASPSEESTPDNGGGFFVEDDESEGQFDMNADKYAAKQIQLANRIEDLTGMVFWKTKPKFGVYDYHLCKDNNPQHFSGVATAIPGIPMYWEEVNGTAELKCRTIPSYKYPTTIVDAAKIEALKVHTRETNLDCYVIWEFTDKDMYYKIDPADFFKTVLGRNTYTTDDLPHEYKPQHLIPISYLTECSPDMFEDLK